MVNKKATKYALVVYHDELNQEEFVCEVVMWTMGYEASQAANCAHMITRNGSYTVKTYKPTEREKAEAIKEAFLEQGVPAELEII